MTRWIRFSTQAALLIAMIFLVRGVFFVARDAVRVAQSREWPSVPGRVLRHVNPEDPPLLGYYPDEAIVEYGYTVNGHAHVGRRIDFHRRSKWKQSEVRPLLARLLRDPVVPVYHAPHDPQVAVLEPGGSNGPNLAFLGLQSAVLALLVFLFVRGWRRTPAAPASAS